MSNSQINTIILRVKFLIQYEEYLLLIGTLQGAVMKLRTLSYVCNIYTRIFVMTVDAQKVLMQSIDAEKYLSTNEQGEKYRRSLQSLIPEIGASMGWFFPNRQTIISGYGEKLPFCSPVHVENPVSLIRTNNKHRKSLMTPGAITDRPLTACDHLLKVQWNGKECPRYTL